MLCQGTASHVQPAKTPHQKGVRVVASMVEVWPLISPDMLVEIEAGAVVEDATA